MGSGRRLHPGCLQAPEPEDSAAAQPQKLESIEQEGWTQPAQVQHPKPGHSLESRYSESMLKD